MPDGGPVDEGDGFQFTPDYSLQSLTDLQTAFFSSKKPAITLNPSDLQALKDNRIDTRVTQYLLYLVTPAPAGAGLGNIKVGSIYKGYDTTGIGRFDRETLDAHAEDPSLISAHNSGQAVDITEVGQVTCKLVEKHHVGADTTHWQSPLPVKVAWQSPNGFASNPTPTGESLVGVAGGMTADSITKYLNESGEMDAYVDYVKGLDIGTIAQYVGANVLLKTLSSAQVQMDPLSGSLVGSIGTMVLLKQLPGLPPNIAADNTSEDIRITIAKAQLEESLGLPPGSMSGYGWSELLNSTGKRLIEQTLGLPTKYLDNHNLEEFNNLATAKGGLNYVKQGDNSFNFVSGTVNLLQKNDAKGLKLAAVNILTQALKLNSEQKSELYAAVNADRVPNIDPSGLNTNNQLSLEGLTSYLTADSSSSKAQQELKSMGLAVLQKVIKDATPSSYSGLTQQLLNNLLNPGSSLNLKDIALSLGAHSLLAQTDLDPAKASSLIANPQSGASQLLAGTIANSLNATFSLKGNTALSSSDIVSMFSNNFDSLKKIGGNQLDKAFNWSAGTGLKVINDPSALEDAMKQTFANGLADLLGINDPNFSLNDQLNQDYGKIIIAERLGLGAGAFSNLPDALTLLTQVGKGKFASIFGLTDLNPNDWENPNLNDKWAENDIALGLPTGSTKAYLKGELSGDALAKAVISQNLTQISPEQLAEQFGLTGGYRISNDDIYKIFTSIKNGNVAEVATTVAKLVGFSVDVVANFSAGDFASFFSAKDGDARTTALLNTGVKLLGKVLGVNLSKYSPGELANIALNIKDVFNNEAAFNPNSPSGAFLTNFLLEATGIPKEFQQDAQAFLTGDYHKGLAGISFVIWQKSINDYLPADFQLTYEELRKTLGINDPTQIDARVNEIINKAKEAGGTIDTSAEGLTKLKHLARQELNNLASQEVQYKISDSFLRKIDPTIPAGFSKVMFTGTDAERAEAMETFVFNNIDAALTKVNPLYKAGSLQAVFNGEISNDQLILALTGGSNQNLLQAAIANSGISLGPLNAASLGNLVTYLVSPKSQQNLLTDPKFTATWGALDNWLSTSTGIGALPTGTAQSIFLASQHNWDFNQSLKDATGAIVVPSLSSLGTDFLSSRVTAWADQALKLPAGTVFRTYQAIKAVGDASQALRLAQASGNISAFNSATGSLSKAQAALAVLAITTALSLCAQCQQIFATVDQAIAAPPGFTNAAVAGAIAMAFKLGPAGLYIAAAIYLFGTYKTEYRCPMPPTEQYGITSFDQGVDQLDFGSKPENPANISSSPAPGQNEFAWGDSVSFTDGKNPKVWQAWSRYYTGKLLDATMTFGAAQDRVNKPLQVITYRQANVEFFNARSAATFGPAEAGNPRVGLGFTQNSTKTTDWVHASFGGFF